MKVLDEKEALAISVQMAISYVDMPHEEVSFGGKSVCQTPHTFGSEIAHCLHGMRSAIPPTWSIARILAEAIREYGNNEVMRDSKESAHIKNLIDAAERFVSRDDEFFS